jgi:hypothetical protein
MIEVDANGAINQAAARPVYEEAVGVVQPGAGGAAAFSIVRLINVQLGYTTNAEPGVRTVEIGMFRTAKPTESVLFDSVDFEEIIKGFFWSWVMNGVAPYMGGTTSVGQPKAELRPLPTGIYIPSGWTAGITVEGKKGTDNYKPRILWSPT